MSTFRANRLYPDRNIAFSIASRYLITFRFSLRLPHWKLERRSTPLEINEKGRRQVRGTAPPPHCPFLSASNVARFQEIIQDPECRAILIYAPRRGVKSSDYPRALYNDDLTRPSIHAQRHTFHPALRRPPLNDPFLAAGPGRDRLRSNLPNTGRATIISRFPNRLTATSPQPPPTPSWVEGGCAVANRKVQGRGTRLAEICPRACARVCVRSCARLNLCPCTGVRSELRFPRFSHSRGLFRRMRERRDREREREREREGGDSPGESSLGDSSRR